ncbi:hypothetical protein VTN00DRAFT_1554 [Thermoascus crustaceus]|uniref:uncharacterized protein n=1 Tax=Thermoascus crustaceus TaxID=5088 RepID=UPI0037435E62
MSPDEEIRLPTTTAMTMTTTTATTGTAATTTPAMEHPATAISIFSQLKRVAESGCKINPELYYTHAGYPEHALQFSRSQYTYLTGGHTRPDVIWQSALDNYFKHLPRLFRRQGPAAEDDSPLPSRYVTAGFPWDLIKAGGCPPSPSPSSSLPLPSAPQPANVLPQAASSANNGAMSQTQSPGRICPAYPNIFDYELGLVPMPPAPVTPGVPGPAAVPATPATPRPRARHSHMLPLIQAGVLAAANNRTPIRRRVHVANVHHVGHGAQGPRAR